MRWRYLTSFAIEDTASVAKQSLVFFGLLMPVVPPVPPSTHIVRFSKLLNANMKLKVVRRIQ